MTGKFIVFDVETVGLTGSPFAVGWVVLGADLMPIEEGWASAGLRPVEYWWRSQEDRDWVQANIPAEVLAGHDHGGFSFFHDAFRSVVSSHPGAMLVADVPVPCEAKFLEQAEIRAYPVLDVATALFMRGLDPIGTYSRRPNELPAHHPLHDARQSARLWREVLTGRTWYLGANTRDRHADLTGQSPWMWPRD